jgi:putative MATE family efflux protein
MINFLDNVMVGSQGLEAINAVGFSNQLFFLYSVVIYGVCTGSAVLTGQYWGKKDTQSIHKVMGIGFISGMALAFLFASVAIIFPGWFLGFYTDNPEIIELGKVYLRIVGISYLITPITMTYNFAMRSIKQTKIPMVIIIIALLVNVTLNYLFIMVFGWGVLGAALATLFARVVELTVQAILIRKLKMPIVAKFKEYMSFNREFVKSCFRITAPVILNEMVWALGMVLTQVAYKGAGDEAQGAAQINTAISGLFFVSGMALGVASGIMTANELGAGNRVRAVSYSRKSLLFTSVVGIIMSGLMILICPLLISLYDISDSVSFYANRILIMSAIFMTARIFNFTTIVGILRNGGDTKFCLFVDCLSIWIIAVPMAFLGVYVFKLPIYWVFALVYLDEAVKVLITGARVLGNKWANTVV